MASRTSLNSIQGSLNGNTWRLIRREPGASRCIAHLNSQGLVLWFTVAIGVFRRGGSQVYPATEHDRVGGPEHLPRFTRAEEDSERVSSLPREDCCCQRCLNGLTWPQLYAL